VNRRRWDKSSAPSRRGEALFQKAFADELQGSNVVFVLHRSGEKLTSQDYQFVDKVLKPGLERIAEQEGGLDDLHAVNRSTAEKRSTIWKISSARDPGSGALLISPDHQATLVVVELTTEFMELRNRATLSQFENFLEQARHEEKVPAGLTIALTGSATVGRDINEGQIQSARATETWTVVLVVGLLLLIYRAPLLALVPLVTVYCALQVSIKLLSLLAETGVVTLFEGIRSI
jgi:putative drug exporter of the RND superfamily